MWLVTKHGFYSVVAHRDDPDLVLVRGRCRQDLEQLRSLSLELAEIDLEIPEIVETPDADYACRIFMPRDTWETLAAILAMNIDYPNFKSEVHGDPERDAAYMQMWSAMRRFQEQKAATIMEYMHDPWAFRRYVDDGLEDE